MDKIYILSKVDPSGEGTRECFAARPVIDEYKTTEEFQQAVRTESGVSADKQTLLCRVMTEVFKEVFDRGFMISIPDNMSSQIVVKESFAGPRGPWVAGVNKLRPNVTTLGSLKNAYAGDTPKNATSQLNPVIDNFTDDYSGLDWQISTGHTFTIIGNYLTINSAKTDEKITLIDSTGAVKATATINTNNRWTTTGSFATLPAAGTYTLVYSCRCGLGEDYSLKTVTKEIKVV